MKFSTEDLRKICISKHNDIKIRRKRKKVTTLLDLVTAKMISATRIKISMKGSVQTRRPLKDSIYTVS